MSDTMTELLTESVHRRLRAEVFTGALAPGEPLSVPALAARLGVSRSPVRDAVLQLIHEGLAVATPRAGARVVTVDAATMRETLEVREVLDGLAARQATPRATQADLDELVGLVDAQEQLLTAPADGARDTDVDLHFHTRVRELSGNRSLAATLLSLHTRGHLYRSATWGPAQDRRFSVAEHRRIVDAIVAGDAVGAEAAARAHVAAVCVRLTRRP